MIPYRLTRALVALALVMLLPAGARAATPTSAAPKNLLANPGFERGRPEHDWMPASWDTSDAGVSTVFFGRDTLLAHSGHYGVNIANTSTVYAMSHNWSQTLLVGREVWNKVATFSVWTRSVGLEGRAYVLIQAQRDTVTKMARIWGVARDEAQRRMGIAPINDPTLDLGWKRLQFFENESGWVRREVKVFVPQGVNVIFLRCGLYGTGQVAFDDASLTLSPAPAAPVIAPGRNLLIDPGFEQHAAEWEWTITPFPGSSVDLDSTVAHGGKASMRFSDQGKSPVSVRMGMCQPLSGRGLGGKRVRLSGWFRGDSIGAECYVKLYCVTSDGIVQSPGSHSYSGTFDWTQTAIEMDLPRDAKEVWAWLMFSAPAQGRVWMDDADLEVIGPSQPEAGPKPAPARRPSAHR